MQVVSLARYLVKSCRGEQLEQAEVEPWGLAGDRRWTVLDDQAAPRTARTHPTLLQVTPRATASGLELSAPGRSMLSVDRPLGEALPATVGRTALGVLDAGEGAASWLSDHLGVPSRLAYLADPTQRPANPDFAEPEDRVSLADGYPILLTTTASLAALNAAIEEGGGEPVSMVRFRPNLVVDADLAWAEDGWRRLRIGTATFRAVKGCDRCVMTTVEPDSGVKGREPIATLARIRRFDTKTWFGMNLIPDQPSATLRIGDDVEILDGVAAGDGPPR